MAAKPWDRGRIKALRAWYGLRVRRHLGAAYKGEMSLPLNAATWLARETCALQPKRIVEFGSGFSTLVFAHAMKSLPHTELVTLDHDAEWQNFVMRCVKQQKGPMQRVRGLSTHEFLGGSAMPFDLCLVDHGPSYDARIAGIAPIVAAARRGGCHHVILDDWHKAQRRHALYRAPVLKILESLGCTAVGIDDSSDDGDSRQLARIVFGAKHRASTDYKGSERAYWETRINPKHLSTVGRRDLSDAQNAKEYERAWRVLVDGLGRCAEDMRMSTGDLSILEFGYGLGFVARKLAKGDDWPVPAAYHGLDFAAPVPRNLPSSFTFGHEDIGETLTMGRRYDVVLALDVLYHVVDDDRFAAALSNLAAHTDAIAAITGLFCDAQTTTHVKHRSLDRFLGMGLEFHSMYPWRDNRIAFFVRRGAA